MKSRRLAAAFPRSLTLTVAVVVFNHACAAEECSQQPNIVFIFTDDQSHETIRALGNDEIITPNLDRLASRGVAFTNAYNMGSWHGAVCVASRTMLNTGLSIWRSEAIHKSLKPEASQGKFWSQLLKSAGYETYMTGKWHVHVDPARLFDYVGNVRRGMPEAVPEQYGRPVEGEDDPWSPYDSSFGGYWEGGTHWSEVVADESINFINEAACKDAPFFMYLAFNAPHDPRQSPKHYVDMYSRDEIRIPDSFLPEYPYKSEIGCYEGGSDGLLRDERIAPFPRTEYAVKTHRQEYYASVTYTDFQIGRILDALEASGRMDNTYIFFTSDHGLACGHHGLLGKQNMYEHSMKPPLIVAGPGVPQGQRREALVYLQDIMATTLELAGAEKPNYVEFHSLLPLIADADRKSTYDAIYGCYRTDRQRMIRVGGYKLIAYPQANKLRLFDLAKDPAEMNDLSDDPQQSSRLRNLFERLIELQQDLGDALDLSESFTNYKLGT